MCLPHTHPWTHTRKNKTREARGSLRVSEQRRSRVSGTEVPRPDHPHLSTLAFGEGASLLSPDPGQQAQLGCHRQPPGGASIHRVSWVSIPPKPGHPGDSQIKGRNTSIEPMLCLQAPAQFLSTSQRPGQSPKVSQLSGAENLLTEKQRFV